MTMLERVGSYSNEYFNSLIREYTDKGKAPESHGMNRAIRAYWANEAAYRWGLRGIAIWSLGQEDMRLWEVMPKQI